MDLSVQLVTWTTGKLLLKLSFSRGLVWILTLEFLKFYENGAWEKERDGSEGRGEGGGGEFV